MFLIESVCKATQNLLIQVKARRNNSFPIFFDNCSSLTICIIPHFGSTPIRTIFSLTRCHHLSKNIYLYTERKEETHLGNHLHAKMIKSSNSHISSSASDDKRNCRDRKRDEGTKKHNPAYKLAAKSTSAPHETIRRKIYTFFSSFPF
jgi:hypothetical protein